MRLIETSLSIMDGEIICRFMSLMMDLGRNTKFGSYLRHFFLLGDVEHGLQAAFSYNLVSTCHALLQFKYFLKDPVKYDVKYQVRLSLLQIDSFIQDESSLIIILD